jgi:hypothetical protein
VRTLFGSHLGLHRGSEALEQQNGWLDWNGTASCYLFPDHRSSSGVSLAYLASNRGCSPSLLRFTFAFAVSQPLAGSKSRTEHRPPSPSTFLTVANRDYAQNPTCVYSLACR